jgi:hypothetical protein|nr:MAG TPA: hydrogenase/urease nickel incorporation protein [Bacteriophage sp.]
MKSESVNVQCQKCGTIFQVNEQHNYIEYLYIQAKCPCCEHENYMLNIGKDILDKYTYYNAVMDERYYKY